MPARRTAAVLAVALATAAGPSLLASAARAAGSSEPTPAAATPTNPCTYVTTAQAEAIMRSRSVSAREAPLGPTCIFTAKGQKGEVTLAVEVIKVSTEVHAMKHVAKSKIAGHTAYCGTLGSSLLLVPLSGGRTALVVTAPCPVARSFAAAALPRVKG